MSNKINGCAAGHTLHITVLCPEKTRAYGKSPVQNEPWERSSAVEHSVHIGVVTGSIPVAPTILAALFSLMLVVQPAMAATSARAFVLASAARHGVPTSLALSIAKQESGIRCGLIGNRGEVGPLQILPSTSRALGSPVTRRSSCAAQTDAGMRHLALCLKRMGSAWGAAACHAQGLSATKRINRAARHYANLVTQ